MPESLGQKSVSGATWAGVSRISQQGLQTLSIAVLARLLSPADYGVMAMGNFFVNFLQQLGDLGTGSAIIQREELSPRLTSSLFWVNVGLGMLGALVLWAAAPLAARYYHEPRVVAVLSLLALAFPATGIGIVPESLLIRNMQYRRLCIAEVGSAVLGTSVAITLAWRGAGVWSLVAGSLTLTLSSSLMLWILSAWRPLWLVDWQEIRSVFHYSMNLTGFVLINYFSRNAGQLIVGRYLGSVALGYYQMAYSLLMYPLQALSSILGRVMFAALSRLQTDRERLRAVFLRYLTVVGAVSAPVFLGLMVVADPLVRVFLGQKWLPVIPLIAILAPVGILQAISSPTGQIYLSIGRTDVMFRLGLVSAVIQVLGYIIGVRWGLEGVVLCWAISSIPVSCAGVYVSHRLIDASPAKLLRNLLPVLACSLTMAAAAWAWKASTSSLAWRPSAILFSTVALGALVYLIVILIFRPAFGASLAQILSYSGNRSLQRIGSLYLGPEAATAQPEK
jgi:PST family polysaccharide transporter